MATSATPWKAVVKRLLARALLIKLRLTNTAVVRTVHNATPHEAPSTASQTIMRLFDKACSRRIYMTRVSLQAAKDPFGCFIPHGHYRDWYMPTYRTNQYIVRPNSALFFGLVRPYKGIESLLNACRAASENVHLTIAGRPLDATYGDRIRELASNTSQTTLILRFLSDRELWNLISSSSLVILPFTRVTNSGSLLLALSASKPVLTTESPMANELQAQYGSEWIMTYDGDLTADIVESALAWAATDKGVLDMSDRDWSTVGQLTEALYREVCSTSG
ncbi:MAG: glycosyltransferase [Propionibacteriaceae bacterium]|jgi:beta-1,4-mannosyltransferase|nr:glycosyltransferase [Propionibacteriaceae bacterium]